MSGNIYLFISEAIQAMRCDNKTRIRDVIDEFVAERRDEFYFIEYKEELKGIKSTLSAIDERFSEKDL